MREDGQHARLELGGVGHDERAAGIRAHGAADVLGDLQRTAAARGPSSGHDAAHDVLGVEALLPHPCVQPVPPGRGEDPGEFLVLEHRFHDGHALLLRPAVDEGPVLQFPRACGVHVHPGVAQGLEQLHGGVRVEGGGVEHFTYPPGEFLHARGPLLTDRTGAEQLLEDLLVGPGAPGDAVVAHVRGHQRALGLEGQQAFDPPGIARGLARPVLRGELRDQLVRPGPALLDDGEQRPLAARFGRGARTGHAARVRGFDHGTVVERAGFARGGIGRAGSGGGRGRGEDRGAQSQVPAAGHPHARGEQQCGGDGGLEPRPHGRHHARGTCRVLAPGDLEGEALVRDGVRLPGGLAVRGDHPQHPGPGLCGGHHDVHAPSMGRGSGTPVPPGGAARDRRSDLRYRDLATIEYALLRGVT